MFAATKSFFTNEAAAGGLTPSWSLDFSAGTPSGYTLTRASTGTYVDSSGYVASASTDVARLTHDSSGSRLGLLVEGQRTNVVLQSNDFLTTWAPQQLASRTANATTSPDGLSNGWRFVESGTSAGRGVFQQTANQSNVVMSVYAKAAQRTTIGVRIYQANNNWIQCTFDLSAGTAGTVQAGTSSSFTSTAAAISAAGNGWYRCELRGARATSTTTFAAVDMTDSATPTLAAGNGTQTYTGDGTSGVFVFGAQMEAVNAPATAYIPTTTASVTRSADLVHVLDSTITGWQDPGALVVHFYPPPQAGTLISTDDASAQQLGIEASSTTAVRAFWSNGQTATGTMTTGVQKAVHYWNGTASSFCLNGGTVQTGTNNVTTFGNIDFVTFGAEATDSSGTPGTFSQHSNLIIRKIEFYGQSLTSGNLQTITT